MKLCILTEQIKCMYTVELSAIQICAKYVCHLQCCVKIYCSKTDVQVAGIGKESGVPTYSIMLN